MSARQGARPDPDTERRVSDWLAHGPEYLPDYVLQEVLQQTAVTPQVRRRLLGRWLDRDEGVGRAADEPDEPPGVHGSGYLLLSLAGVVAAFVLLVSVGGFLDSEPPSSAGAERGLVVASDGSGRFRTIQEAIGAAAPGDVVRVRPGRYEGPVTVDKDLSLVGDGARASIVIAVPSSSDLPALSSREVERPQALLLEGATVTVSDLTIEAPIGGTGIEVTAGSPLIERVSITRPGSDAAPGDEDDDSDASYYSHEDYYSMGFYGRTTPIVRDSEWDSYVAVRGGASATFEGNTVSQGGLSIDGPGSTRVSGNDFIDGAWVNTTGALATVTGNAFIDGHVSADVGSDIEISDNSFRSGPTDGVEAAIAVRDGQTRAVIAGNVIERAPMGVSIAVDASATVSGNEIDSTATGVLVSGTGDVVLQDNTISGEGTGIEVMSSAAPTISGNTVAVDGTGIFVAFGAAPTISDNSVCASEAAIELTDGARPELGTNEVCGGGSPG